ncbi:hypothetical protein MNBD_ALPHA05-2000, partial [hydrothermal vent metagenome]
MTEISVSLNHVSKRYGAFTA